MSEMRSTFFWENPSASLLEKRVRRKAKRKKEGAFGETRSDRFCLFVSHQRRTETSPARSRGKSVYFHPEAHSIQLPLRVPHPRRTETSPARAVNGKVAREIGIPPRGSAFHPASATRTPSARARRRLRRARWSGRDQGYRRSARRRRRNRGRSR